MPRGLSRISLEITNVRSERLNDISEQDSKAEGIWHNEISNRYHYKEGCGAALIKPEAAFMTLWESISGEGSWNENPWVWVIDFKSI